ncbi:MAG: ERCC4 domain-containing protein [Conexivisphaerales archaeon]
MNDDRVMIVCDERERASGVPQELVRLGVIVRFAQLPLGDYILSSNAAVERKSVRDFVSSLYDGRLFKQAVELRKVYAYHILLVEGDPAEISNIAYNPKSYYGALSALALDMGMTTVFTASPEHTAMALEAMARRLTKVRGEKWTTMYTSIHKGTSLHQQQVAVVSSLPGIGPNLAKRLLQAFGSVRGIFTASQPQLSSVPGIGPSKAGRIVKLLMAEYEQEVKDNQTNLI